MIFNIASGSEMQAKIAKYESFEPYNTFVTDAVHIYSVAANSPWRDFTTVWLTWKPGDPVEQPPRVDTSTDTYVWATTTLTLDPFSLISATDVYIPYATSIETFNAAWQWTSDHSDDNLVYTQQCFSTTATIHVNATLRANMAADSATWGDIINNVVADL